MLTGAAMIGMKVPIPVMGAGFVLCAACNRMNVRVLFLERLDESSLIGRWYVLDMGPASASLHRCAEAFSIFRGFDGRDSAQGEGSKAGSGRDRIEWGPIAGTEGGVR